jgi:hypothetical protein
MCAYSPRIKRHTHGSPSSSRYEGPQAPATLSIIGSGAPVVARPARFDPRQAGETHR